MLHPRFDFEQLNSTLTPAPAQETPWAMNLLPEPISLSETAHQCERKDVGNEAPRGGVERHPALTDIDQIQQPQQNRLALNTLE